MVTVGEYVEPAVNTTRYYRATDGSETIIRVDIDDRGSMLCSSKASDRHRKWHFAFAGGDLNSLKTIEAEWAFIRSEPNTEG